MDLAEFPQFCAHILKMSRFSEKFTLKKHLCKSTKIQKYKQKNEKNVKSTKNTKYKNKKNT